MFQSSLLICNPPGFLKIAKAFNPLIRRTVHLRSSLCRYTSWNWTRLCIGCWHVLPLRRGRRFRHNRGGFFKDMYYCIGEVIFLKMTWNMVGYFSMKLCNRCNSVYIYIDTWKYMCACLYYIIIYMYCSPSSFCPTNKLTPEDADSLFSTR